MSKKSRRQVRKSKTAYQARPDQRSDPKPKSKLARQLAKLTPPLGGTSSASPSPGTTRTHRSSSLHEPATGRDPDGALYAYDTQKAMEFADAPDVARIEAQPFLKWAGAKAQLLQQFDKFFPAAMDRYFEPFLGGGAVFFHLKRRFPGMRAFLRDNNADRETYYYLIRSQHHPPAIAGRARPLGAPKAVSSSQSAARPAVAPYQQPIQNDESWQADIIIERAARFIFLNKTCFNGLWRVKARGEFNVPIGSHKNPALYDRDNLLAAQRSVRLMLSN